MEKIERSYELELRSSEENGRVISGYALKFNKPSKPLRDSKGYFVEILQRGAFDSADINDTYLYFNHIKDNPLAAVKNGSLQIEFDEVGLRFSAEVIDTQAGNDVLRMVKSGLIDKCSFGFYASAENYREEKINGVRYKTLLNTPKLTDVSVVTVPAYNDTEVRSIEELERMAQEEEVRSAEEKKAELKEYFNNLKSTLKI